MGYYVNRVREKVTNGQKNSMSLLIYHLLLLIPPTVKRGPASPVISVYLWQNLTTEEDVKFE